jgi:hypothetical protein
MRHTFASFPRLGLARVATLAIAIITASVGGLVGAQSATTQAPAAKPGAGQTWLRVDTVQVKPEMWTEYRQLERDEVVPALRKAGVQSRAAWVTAEFGATYEMVLVRPIADFGEYDAGDMLGKALGPREAERLRERLRRCLLSRDSAAVLERSDLSVGETGRPFTVVTTLKVAPGRGSEYEDFLRETLPEVRKAGIVFGVYQRVYGQENAWLLVENLDSLRELARPPSAWLRAFGQEGGERQLDRLTGVLTSVERKVFRFDQELSFSFGAAAPAAR